MMEEIIKRRFGLECFRIVVFRSRKHVTDVFCGVDPRHRHDDDPAAEKVGPIFPVVFIPFGVVLANVREVAVLKPLLINRGVVTDVMEGGIMEFHRGKFSEVVLKTVEKDAAMEAIGYHHVAVMHNEAEMAEGMVTGFHDSTPRIAGKTEETPQRKTRSARSSSGVGSLLTISVFPLVW